MARIDLRVARRYGSGRWSPFRSAFTSDSRPVTWQVRHSLGRSLREHVLRHARPGDLNHAVRVIEEFGSQVASAALVDVERARRLEEAVRASAPGLVLQLGAASGYAALRAVRALPDHGLVLALEPDSEQAWITRTIWRHAGVADRATAMVGSMGDGWTARALALPPGGVDVVYVGNATYRDDVPRVSHRAWLHEDSVVI